MEETSTPFEHEVQNSRVSGASVFWALLAIVSQAMLQPSLTGGALEGSLSPQRSSPFVCLVDAVADIYMGFQTLRRQKPIQQERTGTLSKLALFALGVVPQAIKLFSMQGIPVTQAIASMFLLSSAVSLIRSLAFGSIQESQRENFQSSGFVAVGLLGYGPHMVGLFVLWNSLVHRVGFGVSEDLDHAVDWICAGLVGLVLLYILQHAIFSLMEKKQPIPHFPLAIIPPSTGFFCIPDLLAAPGRRLDREIVGRRQLTFQMLASLAIACYVIAMTLEFLSHKVKQYGQVKTQALLELAPMAGSSSGSATAGPSEDLTTADAGDSQISCTSEVASTVDPTSFLPPVPNGVVRPESATSADQGSVEAHHQALEATVDTSPQVAASAPETPRDNTARSTSSSWALAPLKLLGKAVLWVAVRIFIAGVMVLSYSGYWDGHDDATEQQSAAEDGAASIHDPASQAQPESGMPSHSPEKQRALNPLARLVQSVLRFLDAVLRFVLKWAFTLVLRLILVIVSLYAQTFSKVEWLVTERHPPRVLMVAFGLVNCVSAAVYYLVFFDAEGTVAPKWADIFG